jgi:ATP-dependent exoDNAse (exonuclease V) alpha subunit
MVRDLCQGGSGVAVVVGRAGTGKTFALGIARHAWQLDSYRLLATAPTGIATVSLEAEGFEEVATCDRLLGDLDRGREQLDGRTVLVMDEAGMLGSRKLARLLDHADQAQAKVVLVGDDRQLASIDAGGGFRALRLRLGASELTENRRQQQAWEREALELVRCGLVEEAVAAYRAHDRMVAAESKPAATLALLQDWWQAWQDSERDPTQTVVVLAGRRAEVDRLNTACQQLLAARGRLGPERLQVEDRTLAVGDRVVCGRNAISQLGWPTVPAGGELARLVPGRPRSGRAQPPGRSGLCHHRPPRPGPDPVAGPGPPDRHRGRQLAVCAAVAGPPGHPAVCSGWPRVPRAGRAGPARPRRA